MFVSIFLVLVTYVLFREQTWIALYHFATRITANPLNPVPCKREAIWFDTEWNKMYQDGRHHCPEIGRLCRGGG